MSTAAASPAVAPTSAPVKTWAVTGRLLRRFAPVRGRALLVLALYVVRTAVGVATPMLLARAIGVLLEHEGKGGPLPDEFVWYATLNGVAVVLRCLSFLAVTTASAALSQDVENALRRELFAKVMTLRFRWHDANRSGKTIARSLRDMEKAKQFFREVVFGYTEIVLLVVGVTVLAFATWWTFGVAAVLVFGTTCLGVAFAGTRIAQMDRAISDDYDRVTTALQENVAGARVVRAFGREADEVERFGARLTTYSKGWKGLSRFWATVLPVVNHSTWLVVPAVLMAGAVYVADAPSAARVTETVGLLFAMRLARDFLRQLTRLLLMGQEAVASASRVFEVLDRDDVIVPPARPAVLPATGGDLRLEGVSFAYAPGRDVLKGVSLHVPAGGSLGILGRTGAGKTTLVHLLPRFYDPTAGRILLDGVPLADLEPEALAAAVGLVFQEPYLFSATVAQNIAYGAPDAPRERIEACARLAAAHEFVSALPKGYDTLVGERGVSLSGGQRQRLTIARALVMEPRVLIFDDATASVDAITEKDLFRGIRAAARGRTTLVVSQRVTSVRWCDRIAVLEDGVVSAVGTHDELLGSSALYREVFEHQTLVGAPS
ncbi:MAG: ABC transporter ATP-binding protein [Planctomycetota bacterium]